MWDRLHRTLRLNVPQRDITVGVPGFQRVDDVGLAKMLVLPFDMDVQFAGDEAAVPSRPDPGVPPTFLLP